MSKGEALLVALFGAAWGKEKTAGNELFELLVYLREIEEDRDRLLVSLRAENRRCDELVLAAGRQ